MCNSSEKHYVVHCGQLAGCLLSSMYIGNDETHSNQTRDILIVCDEAVSYFGSTFNTGGLWHNTHIISACNAENACNGMQITAFNFGSIHVHCNESNSYSDMVINIDFDANQWEERTESISCASPNACDGMEITAPFIWTTLSMFTNAAILLSRAETELSANPFITILNLICFLFARILNGASAAVLDPCNYPQYVFVDSTMSWDDANDHCISTYGTSLATIRNESDAYDLASLWEYWKVIWLKNAQIQTGLHDADQDGVWEWASGYPWLSISFCGSRKSSLIDILIVIASAHQMTFDC